MEIKKLIIFNEIEQAITVRSDTALF